MKKSLIAAIAFSMIATSASAQEGYTQLFDGKNVPDWTKTADANWRVEDGALVADKRNGNAASYLLSKEKYKDFSLLVEVWVSEDANSGIMIRCADIANVGDRTCYEANIFDTRSDPTYGTGAIVHYAEVSPMPKAGGKWNTIEFTAKGRQLTVTMNGQKTADVRNALFSEGPIGLQYGAGTVKFRKVAIKPM